MLVHTAYILPRLQGDTQSPGQSPGQFSGLLLGLLLGLLGLFLALMLLSPSQANAQSLPVTSNIRIWLDADDVTAGGATPASGAAVAVWKDKSGNGHDAASTGSASATYETAGLGGKPSIRLPVGAKFSHTNIFTGNQSPETTIFLVHANVIKKANFVLNLNGDNTATGGVNARFSMHLPWSNSRFYFDAGGCCGTTRVSNLYPTGVTVPHITTAGNSTSGYTGLGTIKQFVRFGGATLANNNYALNTYVTGGFRLGSTSGKSYDGRFSEVIIYDRALTLTEIESVECYLSVKWGISVPFSCSFPVSLSVEKSHSAYVENPHDFAVPSNDFIYQLGIEHVSGSLFDSGTMFVVDTLPADLTFFNGDFDGAGGPFVDPVGFTNLGSTLSFDPLLDLKYSNIAAAPTSMSDCTYTPSSGYDPDVRHICVNLGGSLLTGKVELQYRARID